jgi:hypothetical protein
MNSNNAIDKTKKRLKTIFSINKSNAQDNSKKIKWDINKEYNIKFHEESTSDLDIILNSETFQGIEEYKYVELIWSTTPEIKLLFKLTNKNLDKIKTHISLLTKYNDLIKSQNENLNKSSVFIRTANIPDYYIDKTTILFKEPYLSRKDLFQISQSLVDTVLYPNKAIQLLPNPDNDSTAVGNCISIKGVKPKFSATGLVTSSTNIQMRSSSACLYFLIEIAQDTFQFGLNMKTKFEIIIEMLKNTFIKLKETGSTHIVNIIFFTRIYFTRTRKYKKTIAGLKKFIYQSHFFKNEYFFDLHSSILKIMNISKIDIIGLVDELYSAFHKFSNLLNFTNLYDYLKSINPEFNNIQFKKNGNNLFNTDEEQFRLFNNLFSESFLREIDEFRLTKSISSNTLESINLVIEDIKRDKKRHAKLSNMITVILSGEYFPYYNMKLSKITKEHIYEQGVSCCVVILAEKVKNNDIYVNSQHHDIRRYDSSPVRERERENSFYSSKFSTQDIRHLINRNYEILSSIEEPSLRKKSIDSMVKVSDINYYKNEFNVFNHKIPKWLKPFFISSQNIVNNLNLRKLTNFDNRRKMSIATPSIEFNCNGSEEHVVDNDIINSRFSDKPFRNNRNFEDSEYSSLTFNFNKFSTSSKENFSKENFSVTDENDLKEVLNIYKKEHLDKKSRKETNKDNKQTFENANSTNTGSKKDEIGRKSFEESKEELNENNETTEENREFLKRVNEFELEIFNRGKTQRTYLVKSPKVKFYITSRRLHLSQKYQAQIFSAQ